MGKVISQMVRETIEEYYSGSKIDVPSIEILLLMLKVVDDPRARYDLIYSYCVNLTGNPLREAIYDIDTGCGIDECICRKQTKEEHMRILDLLDQDLIKFKDIFINHISRVKDMDREIFILFSHLIFLFNGYQAPPRLDPKKASEDAMGITDLFGELIVPLVPK